MPLVELVPEDPPSAENQNRSPRLPAVLSITTLVLAVLTLFAFLHARAKAVPSGIIDYADGPTAIFVTGAPLPLCLLAGLTAVMALATLAAFLLLRHRKKD